ncbi:MAG: PQQ-dependent dehydrogenase, methanol/ethanol family [Candidatus Binatia bacterium]
MKAKGLLVFASILAATSGASVARAADAPPPKISAERIREATSQIDDERLKHPKVGEWITYNGAPNEQRYSPLDQINDKNVPELKLAWRFPTNSTRGLEATPLVVDGVMYTTAPWSVVFAIDARTGEQIWSWDPKVPKEWGQKACCDVVNRGVAVYKGKVYVATLDARLAALDAATGRVVWEQQTTDRDKPYTITGAPRVAAGRVLIGNGGSEYGVRGYVSAYDAESGKLDWRTYTVPGDPDKPFESEALEEAAKTWKNANEWLKEGAGGTAWDAITYDPELNLIYFGTGNGIAWDRDQRSPGGGDNLYLTSILAVFADTGKVKWHYQVVPGDTWDFDACQQLVLADLKIDGKTRKVLMQAPKEGFFYVLDRETGQLISAKQYADRVTWATGIDMKTGRPIENPDQRYAKGMAVVEPSAFGAHNWHPMSFSPKTGLVYIPAQATSGAFEKEEDFKIKPGAWNLGVDLGLFKGLNRYNAGAGHLLAWDPVRQKPAWRVQHQFLWNGGTLATAGNLVFQGRSDMHFAAYTADKGKKLWEAPVETGIIAGPMTYMLDGVQYVTVSAGWGGAFALVAGDAALATGARPGGAVLTYALANKLPQVAAPPVDPEFTKGEALYHSYCAVCHGAGGISGGLIPDLRHSSEDVKKNMPIIIKNGIPGTGMAPFGKWVSDDDAKLIQKYVRVRAADEGAGK